jgi:biopolymer transport protein TolR
MGASAGGSAGGYSRRNARRRTSHRAISEINVTPLVDVMLVLLIVFMVAAPLMTVGVPIELPKIDAKQANVSTEPITITVQKDGKLFVQETEIGIEQLANRLRAIARNGYEEQLFLKGDTSLTYGAIMNVMGLLSTAGYKKILLVTSQKDAVPAGQ